MSRSLRITATLRRLVACRRVHRLEDRPPQDDRHPPRGERPVGGRLGRVDARHGAADGLALAAAARRPRRARVRRLADPGVLRLVRLEPGPADLRRRRRVADLRDLAAPPGPDHADHGLGAARARARRRGDAPAGGGRVPARDRPLLDRRLRVARGDLRRRDDRRRGRLLLADRPPQAHVHPAVRAASCASRGRPGPSTRGSTATAITSERCSSSRPSRSCCSSRASLAIYASGRAVGIDLSPLPYVVLGPLLFLVMLVPFTVNGLGVREAFFVSFLGQPRRPRRPGVRLRLPVLRDDDRARGPRASRHPVGERLRPARAGSRAKCLTSRSSSSPGTRCRGSSNVSSPSPART